VNDIKEIFVLLILGMFLIKGKAGLCDLSDSFCSFDLYQLFYYPRHMLVSHTLQSYVLYLQNLKKALSFNFLALARRQHHDCSCMSVAVDLCNGHLTSNSLFLYSLMLMKIVALFSFYVAISA